MAAREPLARAAGAADHYTGTTIGLKISQIDRMADGARNNAATRNPSNQLM